MDIYEKGEITEPLGDISEKQSSLAMAMVRLNDPLEEILSRLGIGEDEFAEWVRDPSFREYTASLARDFAEADEVNVWKSLLDLIKGGSVPAIKLYFDLQSKRTSSQRRVASDEVIELRRDIFGGD
ncbi:MAG: hypothetical protein E7672_01325 [Ruminococcaceae bacterium]|nr:hypothetical protein [Oscillospiraceae bacterium]